MTGETSGNCNALELLPSGEVVGAGGGWSVPNGSCQQSQAGWTTSMFRRSAAALLRRGLVGSRPDRARGRGGND